MIVENTRAGALDMPALEAVAMNPESQPATILSSEQVELVYTQAPVALGAALVVAALLSLALWNVADHTWLLFWFDLQLLQTAVRSSIVNSYRHADKAARANPRWASWYLTGALFSGIIWGCLGLLIDFSWPAEYPILVFMGLAGILAGAISSYAAMMSVYIAFMMPVIIIPAHALLSQTYNSSNEMGILLVVFAGALLFIARNYNASVTRTLHLRCENNELLARLTETNSSLEAQIRERQQAEMELVRERDLFTTGPVTVFRWRIGGDWPIEYASRTVSQFGYDAVDLMRQQTPYASLVHPNDIERVRHAEFNTGNNRYADHGIDYRILTADGQVRWVYDYSIPVRDEDGCITHYAGYLLDITDRKQAEYDLQQEKELAQITLQSIGDAVITTDVNGQVEFLNPVAEKLTGCEYAIARGLSLSRILGHFDAASREGIEKPVSRSLRTGTAARSGREWMMRRHDGSSVAIQYSISPLLSRDGEALGVVLVIRDVTENRNMARQLSYQAAHDALTGLINRREFETRLQSALESTRDGSDSHVLCYLDMDKFKIVNDTCSHSEGDQLLTDVASILRDGMRETDVLARIGGDEFGILLQHCRQEDAVEITEKMLAMIRTINDGSRGPSFEVSASIGISVLDSGTESITALMRQADLACYAAKDRGGNRIHVYQAGDQDLARRHSEMKWVRRLTEAIKEERLVLYRQEIVPVNPHDGECGHFEVLVRMRDEAGELITPARFLPAAERYNLVTALDRWVIDRSFAWHSVCGQEQVMAINLSGNSLADESFLGFVKDRFARHAVSPASVCFEITETAAIANLEHAIRFITELKQLGCRFSLDDFGSGLSSFSYLRNLPVDYLKIDGSFIRDLDSDPVNAAMVGAIAQLSRVMGLKTIAEFVENDAILEVLAGIGIDYAQGYGIARPRPLHAESLERLKSA